MDPRAPFPIIDPALTPEGCWNAVLDMGRRRVTSGSMEADAAPDFFAGVATVLQYLFPGEGNTLTPMVPPMWSILLMCGRADELLKEPAVTS